MKNIEDLKNIAMKISTTIKEKDFFLNGGCSKLVEYFFDSFMKNEKGETELACFFYVNEYQNKEDMLLQINNASHKELIDLLIYYELIISHIAVVDSENKNIIDGHGCNDQNFYDDNLMLPGNFRVNFIFENKKECQDFIENVCATHVFGQTSQKRIKTKIEKLMTKCAA